MNHDVRRERLLEKTFRLFVRRGYAGVTMRDVAAAAGVSTGSLYHYFADKEALAARMFAFVVEREVQAGLAAIAAAGPGADGVEAFRRHVDARARPLGELLHVALDHQRANPASARRPVVEGVARIDEAIRGALGLDEAGAAALLEQALGRLVRAQLLAGARPPGARDATVAAESP